MGKEEERRGREEDWRGERGVRRADDRGGEGIVSRCHNKMEILYDLYSRCLYTFS